MSRSPAGDKVWLDVIDLGSVSAVDTLAVAYGIATRLGPDGNPVLVLADPNEPFLCVGPNEDIERHVDRSFCNGEGIAVLRRRIGGSAIYIDRDQLIFHVIVPTSRSPRPAGRIMPTLVASMIDSVRDFGIAARFRAPSDVLVEGRKIGGAAGAEIGDTVVVGGIFLFNFDCAQMVRCLQVPSDTFRTRLHRWLDRRLTTFCKELGDPPSRETVKNRFVGNLARCLEVEPRQALVSDAFAPTIATAAARLEVPA
jgi:lipoate-protein ligase A